MKPQNTILSTLSRLGEKFTSSFLSLRSPKTIAITGMLIALNVVLSMITIYITPELRLGLSFIPIALAAMLYGPAVGAIAAASGDIFAFILRPAGPYFPGFTISEVLGAVIMGLFLYKCTLKLRNVIVSRSLITVLVNCLLNTYWLSILYGDAFNLLFWPRVIKNVVMLPVEILLCLAVLEAFYKIPALRKAIS